MPTYEFLNNETGEVEEHFMSYTKLDEFKENNPHLKHQIGAPNIVGRVTVTNKTDAGFNEVLSRIGEANPASKLAQTHGNKSIKRIKAEQVVKKHIDKQNKGK